MHAANHLWIFNLIRLRRVGTSLKGLGEYKPRNAEGFLPANDEATHQQDVSAYLVHQA